MVDPEEGPGSPPPNPPFFWTKLRPEGPKKFLETAHPPPAPCLRAQGLDDFPSPSPLSEGLDPPLNTHVVTV